jgi:c(7)-type cytochrome triheme protein
MFRSIFNYLFVFSLLYFLTSCSENGISTYLHISAEEGGSYKSSLPAAESSTDWNVVKKLIPKDPLSNQVDWMAALRKGVIKPRRAVSGPGDPQYAIFRYDFYLPGPTPELDAYFPHSAHTEWLKCASCHPAIFRTQGVKMKMADMQEGKYCGKCHGSVAFGLEACARCHTNMGGAK